jgi:hypothetical protein
MNHWCPKLRMPKLPKWPIIHCAVIKILFQVLGRNDESDRGLRNERDIIDSYVNDAPSAQVY